MNQENIYDLSQLVKRALIFIDSNHYESVFVDYAKPNLFVTIVSANPLSPEDRADFTFELEAELPTGVELEFSNPRKAGGIDFRGIPL